MSWFGSRSGTDPSKVESLEKRVSELETKFVRVTSEVLDATERLERVTRRAFRLREQLDRLEGKPESQQHQEMQANSESGFPESKRTALLRRWMAANQ